MHPQMLDNLEPAMDTHVELERSPPGTREVEKRFS
jgi:hypothetical protein